MKKVIIKKALWPYGARCAFAIRDDDVNVYTLPSMLKRLYRYTWSKGFKISLSVIPNVRGTLIPCIPPFMRGSDGYYPLFQNTSLIHFLKEGLKSGKIGISQHGYAHEQVGSRGEFGVMEKIELSKKLLEGAQIIKDCLGIKPRIFIAPYEDYSEETLSLLKNAGYGVSVVEYSRHANRSIPRWVNGIFNIPRDFTDFSYMKKKKSLIWTLLCAIKRFLHHYRCGGCSVSVNHYWEFFYDWKTYISSNLLYSCWDIFIAIVSRFPHVWKATLDEIMNWWTIREQILLTVKESVSKIEVVIRTSVKASGFTVVIKAPLFSSLKVKTNGQSLRALRSERGLHCKSYFFTLPLLKPGEHTLTIFY